MKQNTAENLSVLMAITGIIMIVTTTMGLFPGQQGPAILTGFFCIMSAILLWTLGR